ncbi:hypothetical protein DSO57_1033881 [Entomophthora muscae]|uniref:Uncharacterized protein n=1 Tax=Entomophthora muscae TaxID=34485 RepID=A0ACC2S242_9FUNG|nr:hypothetical protein DSO57_1033881 [Entomophthora muscae]
MSFLYLFNLLVPIIVYKIYTFFAVPKELKDIPAISLSGSLISMLRGESFDSRFKRLIRPVLDKTGVARMWTQGHWELVFSDAQIVKEIMADADTFTKRREGDANSKIMLANKVLGVTNLATADGEEWRRHRKVANPAFKKTWSTDMFGECTENLSELIKASNGSPLMVQGLFQRLTLDVLGKGLFSYDFEAIARGEGNYYLRLYNDIMKAMFNPIYFVFPFLERYVPWRQISHDKSKEFRSFLRDVIRERKFELTESHDDLLSLMIKASIDEEDAEITDDDVINDLSLFFLAGHDTTANTLTTVFYYLSKHQDIQDKARQEVNDLLKGEKRVPTADEIKAMPYIDCIIKESMRIVSTVPQLRRYCKDGKTLSNGFAIPKDTFVNVQLWKVLHDEKVYSDPYAFNPDRFLDAHGPQDNQWIAFGHGSRMCKL